MNIRFILLILASCSVFVGCQEVQPQQERAVEPRATIVHYDFGQPLGMTRSEYALFLRERATGLAEAEIARLSAIELIYRNKTFRYSFESRQVDLSGSAFGKMYRQFTGFEIMDIVHSDSLLLPLVIDIEFSYDLLGTKVIPVDAKKPQNAKIAQSDHDFRLVAQKTIQLQYDWDEQGNVIGPELDFLARPNHYELSKVLGRVSLTTELVNP